MKIFSKLSIIFLVLHSFIIIPHFNFTKVLASRVISKLSVLAQSPRMCFDGQIIQEKIIELIDSEKKAIKVAMYAFTNEKVAERLVAAHKRGVDVQCIMDLHERNSEIVHYLRKNRITVQTYAPEGFGSSMHLKTWGFASTQFSKEFISGPCVITGSCNCTYNGTYRNVEGMVVLPDENSFEDFDKFFQELKKRSTYVRREY